MPSRLPCSYITEYRPDFLPFPAGNTKFFISAGLDGRPMDSEAFRLEIVERINAEYENNADRRESFISEIANGLCEFD